MTYAPLKPDRHLLGVWLLSASTGKWTVNCVVTGESTVADTGSLLRSTNKLSTTQDYLVLPDQLWLDGISTTPGIAKQFAAAETAPPRVDKGLSGNHQTSPWLKPQPRSCRSSPSHRRDGGEQNIAGASVEWQVTGEDVVGGIQLQIIPTFKVDTMFAGTTRNVCHTYPGSRSLCSCGNALEGGGPGNRRLSNSERAGLKRGRCRPY